MGYYVEKSKYNNYYYIKHTKIKYNEIRCIVKLEAEELCKILNEKEQIQILKEEDKRLNNIIIDLYDEIAKLKKLNKNYLKIIDLLKELVKIFLTEWLVDDET